VNNHQHRLFLLAFTVLPLVAFVVGIGLLVTGRVTASDLVAFGVMYAIAGFGISAGYHRLLAHRSFVAGGFVRYALATGGAIAGQGPPIIWVAHHRRHHRRADQPGDPHSPYEVDDPATPLTWRGFWRSHLTWLLKRDLTSDPIRYCPDLARDRGLRFISNHFVAIVVGGVVLGGLIGWAVSGRATGFLTGMLWGGLIRIFVCNHMTYAVNSVGHTSGRRRFATPDESRNVAWLAIPSFGEAWHNNHHAFPRSFRHGMAWYEVDLSAVLIASLERVRLARQVVRIDPATRGRLAARWAATRQGNRADPAAPPPPMASVKGASAIQPTDVE
jgi:stearoyl-CoA desaturase (Delta-9 desaturase)